MHIKITAYNTQERKIISYITYNLVALFLILL